MIDRVMLLTYNIQSKYIFVYIMSKIKFILAVIATPIMLLSIASGVNAQEVEEFSQEQEQTIEWTCDSYGQCSATTSQNQKMYATRRLEDGRWVYAHMPVGTAVDMNNVAAMAGVVTTGVAAAFLKISTKS
jgi:hypothetical protein